MENIKLIIESLNEISYRNFGTSSYKFDDIEEIYKLNHESLIETANDIIRTLQMPESEEVADIFNDYFNENTNYTRNKYKTIFFYNEWKKSLILRDNYDSSVINSMAMDIDSLNSGNLNEVFSLALNKMNIYLNEDNEYVEKSGKEIDEDMLINIVNNGLSIFEQVYKKEDI